MTPAIHAEHVTVRYGRRRAVDDVTLSIASGSLYALLGRNGAGKSSLVRCLLGQFHPDHGRVALLGEDVWKHRQRLMERVGVVPEDADAPPNMRVRDLAHFSSRLYKRWSQLAFDQRIARFAIDSSIRFGDLSKGQKKQIALALALAASPELVILDDPTLGLDVVARKLLFEELIADVADRGITVLITTHDLSAIEPIVDRVGVLRDGEIVLDEDVETLKSRFRRIRFVSQPAAVSATNFVPLSIRAWGSGTEAVISNYDELAFERMREAAKMPVADVSPMTLEEIFISVSSEKSGEGR